MLVVDEFGLATTPQAEVPLEQRHEKWEMGPFIT